MFSKNLSEKLDEFHLLKHPFYIAWNKGELSREIIKDYAEQYYNHVKAFPRYISATHSLCEDISKKKFYWKIFGRKKILKMIIQNYGKVCNCLGFRCKGNRKY